MANDITISSWAELTHELYSIEKTGHGRYRSNFMYRGVADTCWELKTSLQRLGDHCTDVERPLLRSFTKYARPGELSSQASWFRLAVAQHHGLPTRLMDWSVSPKVAMHFATCEEEHFDKDGAIWCFEVVKARELLPSKLKEKLYKEAAFLFSIEMLEEITTVPGFDDLAVEGEFVIFFEPPSLDARIINQGAIMSVMPGASMDMHAFLHKPEHVDLYRRIIIPKELKWEIRDKLDQDNVTERMLFPGLDGVSRWLKRYYGLGPNGKQIAGRPMPPNPQ